MIQKGSVVEAPFVLSLAEIGEEHHSLVGGKAASLAVLARAGFPVPEGFVLTSRALAEVTRLPAVAEAIRALGAAGELAALDDAQLEPVRAQIVGAGIPAEVRAALEGAYRRLFSERDPLAVRSSGTKEDLEGASFAGQYETFLDVRGATALEVAIKRCWASMWRARVLSYAAEKGGGTGELAMAVVVQRLVPAEAAGVLFTVNPLTGRETETTIEGVRGLGEALVSGRVTADRFLTDPLSGAIRERHPTGAEPCLTDAQLVELTEIGARIQEHYGRPMDVEWCLAGGSFQIVQARPITRLHFAPDVGEWTTADFKDGGVSSDVCSMFMWSLYEMSVERSMPAYFKDIRLLARADESKWMSLFFARPYWNLGKTKSVLQPIPGYNERNFDTDLGIVPTYEGAGVTTKVSAVGVVKALPVLFALKRSYKEVLEHDRRLVEEFAARKAPYELADDRLAALDRAAFGQQWRALITDLYFETETSYFTTIYNTSNSKLDFKVHFERARQACGGALDYLKLMGGLENLSHLRPLQDLHELAGRLHREERPLDDETVRAFADRWRHHGQKELDIRVPRWHADLPFVRQMIEQAIAAWDAAQDPATQVRQQHAAYLAERDKAARALRLRPLARRSFLEMLELVRKYAWWREELRDHSSYAYYLVRKWSVEAARRLVADGRLAAVDDLWNLTFQDALALYEGTISVEEGRKRVRAGERRVRSFRNFQNPNEIGAQYRVDPHAKPVSDGALRGTPCSPGRVEGVARVVKRLDEMHRVGKGEILVTVFTDPGWTPLFARLSGVVTETGGVLAHAAVISREYGIPAVLAVSGATQRIPDGARIALDGTGGTVELLD